MEWSKEEIGRIIKKARLDAGLTQIQVAKQLKRPQQTIGNWEVGRSQPDANTLFELFQILGADINEAFGFTTKKDPANHSVDEARAWAIAAIDQMSDEDFEAVALLLRRFEDKRRDK